MPKCPKCESYNHPNNKFCGQCGQKLPEPKNHCPNCDLIFINDENYCTECGQRLVSEKEYGEIINKRKREKLMRDRLYKKVYNDLDDEMITKLNEEIGSPSLSYKSRKEILDYIFSKNSIEKIRRVAFQSKWQICPKCNHQLAKTAKKCPYCNEILK